MNIKQKNIYTEGAYLVKNPTWHSEDSLWKAEEIDKMIKRNNLAPATVADIGSGAGQVLVHLSHLNPQIAELTGFDISLQATEIAKQSENEKIKFFHADFSKEISASFDLVLVIDVLEHLNDYPEFLQKIKDRGQQFIFHIPLDLSCRTLLKPHVLLQQRNDVGHIHYFSKEHVEWFLKDAGYNISDWFYTLPETDRRRPKGFKRGIKKMLRRISFSLNKDLSAKLWGGYSIMILATRNE